MNTSHRVKARSLSETEARVVLSLEAERKDTVTLGGIRERASVSPGFARKLAHALVRKGWLQRLRPGLYLLSPSHHGPDAIPDTDPFRLGSRLVAPYYFGYATAAELHGLLPQASRTYYLVTTARGTAHVKHPAQFRRIHITKARFFGTETVTRRGETLVVSDRERTVLDCLTRPEFSGGIAGAVRVLESAGRGLDWRRLTLYLRKWKRRSLTRKLGYLAELLGSTVQPPGEWIRRALPHANDSYVPLGHPAEFGRRGVHNPRWRIIENVPKTTLLAEVDLR